MQRPRDFPHMTDSYQFDLLEHLEQPQQEQPEQLQDLLLLNHLDAATYGEPFWKLLTNINELQSANWWEIFFL